MWAESQEVKFGQYLRSIEGVGTSLPAHVPRGDDGSAALLVVTTKYSCTNTNTPPPHVGLTPFVITEKRISFPKPIKGARILSGA